MMGDPLGSSRVSSQKQNREGVVGAQSGQYHATVESSSGCDGGPSGDVTLLHIFGTFYYYKIYIQIIGMFLPYNLYKINYRLNSYFQNKKKKTGSAASVYPFQKQKLSLRSSLNRSHPKYNCFFSLPVPLQVKEIGKSATVQIVTQLPSTSSQHTCSCRQRNQQLKTTVDGEALSHQSLLVL
ncbi:hypothetical protein DVH24_033131 [Malus domestica]|uniref:Uncharacterized protein n=1 Tax=Malus domestica TaxID=3750 RepID=A0A498JBL8_MALDO|nr:hypothetical protein DVH24_033131 [Malus domestica]